MSAESVASVDGPDPVEYPDDRAALAPEPVEVRRNGAVSAVIGAAAAAIALAYLARAVGNGEVLDWVLLALMGTIAATFLRALLDARTPLLVADEMGVRIRFGTQWRALPWDAIDQVVVRPRRGLLHDGRLIVTLHHLHRAIEGLQGRALRAARINQRMYGAVIAAPLGITTRVPGGRDADLVERMVALSRGRTDVVTLLPPTSQPQAETDPADEAAPEAQDATVVDAPGERRHRWLRRAHEQAPEPHREADDPSAEVDAAAQSDAAHAAAENGTPAEPGVRMRGDLSGGVIDAITPAAGRGDGRVRAIARLADPVPPPVIREFEPEPAYDPVIGPELAAARTRVGLSVDELADRTRIRPHVIESIEADDFRPCGGDFYARGHIRTLARVLGKDPAPLLEQFEARYATAPVSPRRVFEAELATGMTGSMRSTVGGPNWVLLIGVALVVVLVWSAVRLFAGGTPETFQSPPPVLNGSGGLTNGYAQGTAAPSRVPVSLTAGSVGAQVQVRNGADRIVFAGSLAAGEVRQLRVAPPITVTSDNGATVSVTIAGRQRGPLGSSSGLTTRVFQRPRTR